MNDPILEVLREIKNELVSHGVQIGQLVRYAEHTSMRLDEHTAILHEQTAILGRHDKRLGNIESHVAVLDRNAVATVATLELLQAGVQTIARRFDLGQLGEERLEARVEDCERRLDALEHDR